VVVKLRGDVGFRDDDVGSDDEAAASLHCSRFFSSASSQPSTITNLRPTSVMAIPPVEQLQRPEPLRDVLAKDKPEDCLPCRVTGKQSPGYWRCLF
jgi:hypothetical protein